MRCIAYSKINGRDKILHAKDDILKKPSPGENLMDLPTSLEVVSLSYAIHAKDALCGTLKQPRSAMSIRIGNGV